MNKLPFSYLLIIILLAIQCRKPDFQRVTKTTIVSLEAAGPTSVKITATVVDLSSADHNGAGVCFSDKDLFPTLDADSKFEFKATPKGETGVYLLPGLLGNTVYYVRFYVLDDGQPAYSEPQQVKTLPYPNALTTVKPCTQISYTSVSLHGTVNSLGMPSTFSFEFGQTKDNLQSIDANPKTADGSSSVEVLANVTHLLPNTSYIFHIKVVNQGGTFFSADSAFTTKKYQLPLAATLPPNKLTKNSASLRGSVNAQDQASTFSIECGTTTAYGETLTTTPSTASGHDNLTVSADISGLSFPTVYHYRVKAENATGITYGSDFSFSPLHLSVSFPTAATSWKAGLEHKISYDANFSDSLKIDLYKAGAFVSPIIAKVLNFGSYTWAIPADFLAGNDYSILVSHAYLPLVYGESPQFAITATPNISISTPSTTDNWPNGSTQSIQWTSNYAEPINIDLYKTGTFLQSISTNAGNGSYQWVLPKNLVAASDYAVKVSYISTPGIFAMSNNFTISPLPFVKISAPTNTSDWYLASSYPITWTDNISENVKIDLNKGGFFLQTIAASNPSNGSFTWTIPANLALGNDYSIKITSTTNPSITDESLPFVIDPARFINISMPNAATVWKANTTHSISWTKNISETVKIELLNQDGSSNSVIWPTASNSGTYAWQIPASLKAGSYAIKISSTVNAAISNTSAQFSMLDADFIQPTFPSPGINWDAATNQTITWNDNISAQVKIDLYKSGALVQNIVANTPSNGSYNWTVPKNLSLGADYQIWITSADDPSLIGKTDNFNITPPYIAISQPNSSSQWPRGVEQKLVWKSNIADQVRLDLYLAGASVENITPQASPSGTFNYTPPNYLNFDVNYKLRATSTADPKLWTESSFFAIVLAVPSTVIGNANHIVQSTATLNGQVNANNYSTTVSFEYGETTNYGQSVSASSPTITGGSLNSVLANLMGLTANTVYHFRIKAINSQGTSLSDDQTFTTIRADQVVDADYNVYNTIQIGPQVWIKENLKTTHFDDGSAIKDGTGIGAYGLETSPEYFLNYNDDGGQVAVYGRLYTWYAAMDTRNVCPVGWHLPTNADITALQTTLGSDAFAGGAMKEISLPHWANPNGGADNSSNFTGLPGGYRDFNGGFFGQGIYGYFWTAGELDFYNAITYDLFYSDPQLRHDPFNKSYGFSVRCLKN